MKQQLVTFASKCGVKAIMCCTAVVLTACGGSNEVGSGQPTVNAAYAFNSTGTAATDTPAFDTDATIAAADAAATAAATDAEIKAAEAATTAAAQGYTVPDRAATGVTEAPTGSEPLTAAAAPEAVQQADAQPIPQAQDAAALAAAQAAQPAQNTAGVAAAPAAGGY